MADDSSVWHPYERGGTIGQRGSEEGLIVLDEEHAAGARITLERERDSKIAPFAVTCGQNGLPSHLPHRLQRLLF